MKGSQLQVLSISLAEAVLLLFFILLLVLAGRERQHANELGELQNSQQNVLAEKEQLERKLQDILSALEVDNADQEGPEQILVSLSKLDFVPARAKDKLVDMIKKLHEYQKMVPGTGQQLQGKDIQISFLQESLKREKTVNQQNTLALRDIAAINNGLAEKVEQCTDGEGYPPCWKSTAGDIQYMYNVHLQKDGIKVERAWPEERDLEMQGFEAAQKLAGNTVELNRFVAETTDVFQASKEKQCRYFVRVYGDKSSMDSEMFSDYQGVQNNFYHFNGIK